VPFKDRDKKNAYKRAYYRRTHPVRPKPSLSPAERVRMKREKMRSFIREYKATHPCVDCGEADPIVLEFDHREPSEKSFSLSDARRLSLSKIAAEIAKCDVRCANCHRRRTHHERHSYLGTQQKTVAPTETS
jgi:hypothetical protein